MGAILIVDDMEDLRFSLAGLVRKEGHTVFTAANGLEALEAIGSSIIDLIFLDIGLPDTDGISLIGRLKDITPDVDIVMLTGNNEAKTAVDALRAGAVDYIVKPFELIEFRSTLQRIMQSRLMDRKALLESSEIGLDRIIGSCEVMRRVKETILMASEVGAPVLVTGETGTGKELVARAIHEGHCGQSGVFVKVDCGTLSENLVESELFGHTKGAFTDALQDKKGLVELADGGTLFLDEIGNLPISLQPKLLRLIEESTFRKVGGINDIQVRLRIIAATNSDIEEEIDRGRFREDLYYRLNVIPIVLPPLRDRDEDVLLLAEYFLHNLKKELKKEINGFTPAACREMLRHDWPGNIRELRNLIEREVIFCRTGWLSLAGLNVQATRPASPATQETLTLRAMERQYIERILKLTNNNKSKAARILGISRTTLREKLDSDQFLTT
jgi:two-component system, NtrC family, response regulator AtoC